MFLTFARFFSAVSAHRKSWIIAFSMASGLTLVLIPGATLLWFLFLIPLMLVRINLVALIATMALGRILVNLIDPYTEHFGYYLLTRGFLYEPMGRFLSIPFVGWLRLDDSFVFGGFFTGIIGWPLFFLFFLLIVRLYRKYAAPKIRAFFLFLGARVPLFGKLGKALAETRAAGGRYLSKDKRVRIPLRFRRPLNRRGYRTALETVSNRTEFSLLESVFFLGEDGKYHYQDPPDRKTAESAAALLKKIHRNKSDFHVLRIIFVTVIICLPILFNVFFLDRLAARQLEKFLETLSRTDVTVEGLDIAPLAARISLDRLGFASKTDPMVDRWQVQDVVGDVSWGSLSFRRLIFEELRGTSAIDVARRTPAVYPTAKAGKKPSRRSIGKFSGTDWMPSAVIPDESVRLAKTLRETYEIEYEKWTSKVEKDIASSRNLGERVKSLISESLPETVDGWIARVEEGRGVVEEISSTMASLNTYKRDFDVAFRNAMGNFERARAAVERDLDLIERTFKLDRGILNTWLQSLIDELAGPRFGEIYRQAASNTALSDFLGSRGGRDKAKKDKKGRMKQGRIVQFPVRLPPRFSIKTLNIAGGNLRIVGENIGIDHNLAGAPSHFLVEFDGFSRLDALTADITVDGRTGADNVMLGRVDFNGWDWLINYEDERGVKGSIGGLFGASTTLSAVRTPELTLKMAGLARLTDWKGLSSEGVLSFVRKSSPPLGFQFEAQFKEKKSEFKVSVLREYLQDWIDTLLLEGREKARQLLLDKVGADLENFDTLLVDWNEQGELLNAVLGQLAVQRANLQESIAEWTEQATGEFLPSTGLFEGLRSLF